MGKLRDRVAIVTGDGRGIGTAMAVALANQGAHIVLAAKTSQEIETVANRVRTIGRQALAMPTDVSKKEQVDALAAEAYQAFGQVDILVNNAGVAIHNPIPKIELSDWQTTLDVNLTGVFLCTQAVFENMCQQKSGHIKMSLLRLVYGPVPNLVAMLLPNLVSLVLPSLRWPSANVTALKLILFILVPLAPKCDVTTTPTI